MENNEKCTWYRGCVGKVVAKVDLYIAPGADKNARFCAVCAETARRYQVPITYNLEKPEPSNA